jgi:putative transposase
MPNHYHLLIQTPVGNLSKCMRQLNGVYTQRFNRTHKYDGQLFRGRFKSILVEADSYLLELLRYIHNNPLRAGLSHDLNDYEWSSHKGYMSDAKKWDWLYKGLTLSLLSKDLKDSRRVYKEFMAKEGKEEISLLFEKKKLPSILGSKSFVSWVKERFFEGKAHSEVPESKLLAPDKEAIQQFVCKTYGITEEELIKSRRGFFNEPRGVAIYLTRLIRRDNLMVICRDYNLKKYSSASSVVDGVKQRMLKDREFYNRVKNLNDKLTKGQTET